MKRLSRYPFGSLMAAAVLAGVSVFASCSEEKSTEPPPPPPTPQIDTVSETVVQPGDMLVLTGSNFAVPAIDNIVYFNNVVGWIRPTRSTGDSLEVLVPGNANSGGMYVRSQGVRSNSLTVEVQRSLGEPWIVGEGNVSLKLPTPQGDERYLVVPHSAQPSGVNTYTYTVTPDTTSVFPVAPESFEAPEPTLTLAEAFESFKWRDHEAYMNSDPPQRKFVRPEPQLSAPGLQTFSVLKCQCSTSNPASYAQVTAELKYNGTHGLIYADVNQPTGSFTQADYNSFGQDFDAQIFPVDTMAFGPPTDIDNNDKVIILFTPVVNQITPPGTAAQNGFVSGFFLQNDLAPNRVPAATTNEAEIFYAVVPDPNNEYGNAFNRGPLLDIIPGTLAHEFEHMISYGYRYWTLGGGTSIGFVQVRWFEEGMAHIAEDLNNLDTQNILRGNRWINSPLSQKSVFDNDDSLEQRGAVFLFLRYLGDRFGEAIYREFVETACTGQLCTTAVVGVDFYQLLGDFLATLYLSNRGITNDPRYNFTSFDFQTEFDPIPITTRDFNAGMFSGSVRNGTGQFWILEDNSSPAAELNVLGSNGSRMRMLLVPIP